MRRSSALWGVLLIFIGLVWLLSSTNTVNIDLIGSVTTLWPIFIIAGGITLFLRHESHVPRVILWVLVFAIIAGYGVYLGGGQQSGTALNKSFGMKAGIQSASLEVNTGAADFNFGSVSQDLAQVRTNIKGISYSYEEGSSPKIKYSQQIQFKGIGRKQSFNADLNDSVTWDVELNTGATSGTINFKDLALKQMTINTGACDLDLIAGSKLSDSRIVINGGAVNLKINIPEDVGLKISSSSAVTKVNGRVSMLKQGSIYLSDNFDSAPNKLYLDITSGFANISVNR